MGLDFNNAEAYWSYSGFGRFRERLAESCGFHLSSMWGFGGNTIWTDQGGDLQPLLNHSDCDGEITPEECARVAPALRAWASQYPADGVDGHDQRQALLLAEGMEGCAARNEPLIFC